MYGLYLHSHPSRVLVHGQVARRANETTNRLRAVAIVLSTALTSENTSLRHDHDRRSLYLV